jgi:hypothetical protein
MMKQIAMLILATICTSGCMRYIISEPLPAILPAEVTPSELPDRVRSAIQQCEPDAEVTKAVGWRFKKKITFYDVTVRDAGGERTYDVSADGTHCQLKQEQEAPNQASQAIGASAPQPER